MIIGRCLAASAFVLTLAPIALFSGSTAGVAGVPTQMVITARAAKNGQPPQSLLPSELTVVEGRTAIPVISMERLTGDLADMQLFLCLDDSTRASSLGVHLPELKTFIESLPATTEVAIGYMRNGTFAPTAFTTDHDKAAASLRPPLGAAGLNGSPYFGLSELVKHWPSKNASHRRAVVMLTDGVDPYYGNSIMDDPYVDNSIRDALKGGIAVYSIYLRGAGSEGHNGWVTNMAQSRLMQVSDETGGHAYFQDFTDPVTIAPFLFDLQDRFDNQYLLTVAALDQRGLQPVKVRTELPGLKIDAQTHILVR